jgi:hypothetical protein
MRAVTKLEVKPDMRMTVILSLSVEEADSLLEATKDVNRWPMSRFKECFHQALSAARASYASEHLTD